LADAVLVQKWQGALCSAPFDLMKRIAVKMPFSVALRFRQVQGREFR
jgi:hypothetical protein